MDRNVPVPSPTPREADALAAASRYLARAAAAVGTRQLSPLLPPREAVLLDALHDQILAGAALCDGMLELTGSPAEREPRTER